MHYINGTLMGVAEPTNVVWQITEYNDVLIDDGVTVSFRLSQAIDKREAINYLRDAIKLLKIEWLSFKSGKWYIDLGIVATEFGDYLFPQQEERHYDENVIVLEWVKREPFLTLEHLMGTVECEMEIVNDQHEDRRVNFILTAEYIMESYPKKIFLSHKGVDKPRIREFKNTLVALGFEPWLDEDAMPAGIKLERGILRGFKDSCAAVFFVTPSYKDEGYLETEIDYAIAQKREKKDRFSIITLVLDDGTGNCTIPELLKPYVWKTPKTDLEAIREIVSALPIKIASTEYKKH